MSFVFVVIVEDGSVYFGRVHWRHLDNAKKHLRRIDLDGGYIFYDRSSELFIDRQSCVILDRTVL